MTVAFEDQCGRPAIATRTAIDDDPGKQRYREMQRGHDGEHCTTYCGMDFEWSDAMSETVGGLLPCPFCGAVECERDYEKGNRSGVLWYKNSPSSDMEKWDHVVCLTCGAGCNSVEKWNTRCVDGHVVTFVYNPAGVVAPVATWIVFDSGYMYGPREDWRDVACAICEEWQHDSRLVG